MYISIEGADGVGKTTQANMLVNSLKKITSHTIHATLVREPGGTPTGEKIRDLIFAGEQVLDPMAETALFLADRIILLRQVRKFLSHGVIVVSDRSIDSALVYQGLAREKYEEVLQMHKIADALLFPDLTIIIDLPVEKALARIKDRDGNNFNDRKPIEFHEEIREDFETLGLMHKDRNIHHVNGDNGKHDVHQEVMFLVSTFYHNEREWEDVCL